MFTQEDRRAATKEWLKHNRERVNESRRQYVEKARQKALALFGTRCEGCGFDDPRALQIDHKNGGGTKERKQGLMGYRLYTALVKGERKLDDLQLLCANCHVIKQRENKEWTTWRTGLTRQTTLA